MCLSQTTPFSCGSFLPLLLVNTSSHNSLQHPTHLSACPCTFTHVRGCSVCCGWMFGTPLKMKTQLVTSAQHVWPPSPALLSKWRQESFGFGNIKKDRMLKTRVSTFANWRVFILPNFGIISSRALVSRYGWYSRLFSTHFPEFRVLVCLNPNIVKLKLF